MFNYSDEIEAEKYTGGITGYIEGGTVENCYSSFQVYAGNYTGGICGYLSNDSDGNTGRITNCYTTASVETYEDNSIYRVVSGFCGKRNGNKQLHFIWERKLGRKIILQKIFI